MKDGVTLCTVDEIEVGFCFVLIPLGHDDAFIDAFPAFVEPVDIAGLVVFAEPGVFTVFDGIVFFVADFFASLVAAAVTDIGFLIDPSNVASFAVAVVPVFKNDAFVMAGIGHKCFGHEGCQPEAEAAAIGPDPDDGGIPAPDIGFYFLAIFFVHFANRGDVIARNAFHGYTIRINEINGFLFGRKRHAEYGGSFFQAFYVATPISVIDPEQVAEGEVVRIMIFVDDPCKPVRIGEEGQCQQF